MYHIYKRSKKISSRCEKKEVQASGSTPLLSEFVEVSVGDGVVRAATGVLLRPEDARFVASELHC